MKPNDVQIKHIFQTNGTLFNEKWCDLIHKYPIVLGLSLDGPAFLHNQMRRDRRGRGSFDRVAKGIDLLNRYELEFYILSVLTDTSLDFPDEIFEFFVSIGATEVCFNFEELEGVHVKSSLGGDQTCQRVKRFFRRYYELLHENGFPHWVREFEFAFNAVLRAPLTKPINALVTPFRSLNIDFQGNFSTFSPELLGMQTENYGTFQFGNLLLHDIDDCRSADNFLRAHSDITAGVRQCEETCSYFAVCGGGAPSNKLYENGSFISSETTYCRLTIKTMIDLVLEIIEDGLSEYALSSVRKQPALAKSERGFLHG